MVARLDGLRFVPPIKCFWRGRLHAVRQLERRDPRVEQILARAIRRVSRIHALNQVKLTALRGWRKILIS